MIFAARVLHIILRAVYVEHLTRWENEWSVIGAYRPFDKRVVVVVVIFKKEEEEILTVQFQLGTLRFMDLVSSRERERKKKGNCFCALVM